MAILIDCTESFCKENIRKRFQESKEKGENDRPGKRPNNSKNNRQTCLDDNESTVKQRLGLFKQNTLPMLKHLDDKGKLRVVRSDRDQVGKIVPLLSGRIDCFAYNVPM